MSIDMPTSCSRGVWAFTSEVLLIILYSAIMSAQNQPAHTVVLVLRPGRTVNHVPDTFSFIFMNTGDHELRVPPLSPCIGQYSGRLRLRLEFSPIGSRGGSGTGGGCGGGVSHVPGILDQVKSWRSLGPGRSLAVTYARRELFVAEQRPGVYEFWGEYEPPRLSEAETSALGEAGIDFPSQPLTSAHLRFKRSN